MLKRIPLLLFMLAITSVVLFNGIASSEAKAINFSDIGDAAWAEMEISEMSSLGILKGYPDGRFLPYQSVNRLESIAMLIRMIGKEDRATAVEEAVVSYKMPSYVPWGRGYLITAVEEGMLDKNYLDQLAPTGAASRAQVAALTCLALDLELSTAPLTFADAADIPSGYKSYVATLVEHKLMQGMPGNVFEPNSSINRAQMAVLLSNLLNNDFANPYPGRYITGVIAASDPGLGLIALQDGSRLLLSKDCRYYLGREKASMADLKPGDRVRLIKGDDGQIAFVRAERTASQGGLHQGLVENVILAGSDCWIGIIELDGTKTFKPAPNDLLINDQGDRIPVINLAIGSYVEIKVDQDRITQVNVLKGNTLTGKVSGVRSSRLTISESGFNTDFDVPDGIPVLKAGKKVDFDEISLGDEVEVTYVQDKVVKITILEASSVEGEINLINSLAIVIEDDRGYQWTYNLSPSVKVSIDGDRARLADLDQGDRVKLEFNVNDYVKSIEVLDKARFGEDVVITGLRTGKSPYLRFELSDGDEERYDIASDVEIIKDRYTIDLEDIVIGSEARVEIEDGEIVTIEIIDDENITIEGEIIDVRVSSERIRIEQQSGNQFTYYLEDGARLRDSDGYSIDLEDVEEGWDVELQLRDGEVRRLTQL
ncbi:MAG: S-layer homology domain-containing protein [Pelotomaculum sp.]|jgi:hypothetical protein